MLFTLLYTPFTNNSLTKSNLKYIKKIHIHSPPKYAQNVCELNTLAVAAIFSNDLEQIDIRKYQKRM